MFMVFVKLGYVYGVWRAIYFLFSTCTGEDLVKVFEENSTSKTVSYSHIRGHLHFHLFNLFEV